MRSCIFCGGVADSKEHVWPAWLHSMMSNGEGATVCQERDGAPTLEWHGVGINVKVRRTCRSCNNGWMSNLEAKTKPVLTPLILGQAVDLNDKQQLDIAIWSVKTAMVFDSTRRKDRIYFSQQERECLFRACACGLNLPFAASTWVWLAKYRGQYDVYSHGSVLRGYGEEHPNRTHTMVEGHVFTVAAGAFVAQILIARLPRGAPNREEVFHDAHGSRWERATTRIWPLRGRNAGWPPQVQLDDEIIDEFALRWPSHSTSNRRRRS